MNEQEEPMQIHYSTKGKNGELIHHFYEVRVERQNFNRKDIRLPDPPGFREFLAQDKHHESIVTDIAQSLERWFSEGVTYSENTPMSFIAGVPAYDNMPIEVYRVLGAARVKIALNVLKSKRISPKLWPEVLMVTGRALEGKTEREAIFRELDGNPSGPAIWSMWDSKDTSLEDVKERARLIAENFYEVHVMRLLYSLDIEELTKRAKTLGKTFAEADYDMDRERELLASGLDIIDLAEYYALEDGGFRPSEVATMLRNLGGIDKSPREIARNHKRIKNSLPSEKLKQFLIKIKGA